MTGKNMRSSLIAGNWKMNGSLQSAIDLVEGIMAGDAGKAELAVCPPAVYLMKVGGMLTQSNIALGAQNVCDRESGAFTGEISTSMLKECGCRYAIVGHSERVPCMASRTNWWRHDSQWRCRRA